MDHFSDGPSRLLELTSTAVQDIDQKSQKVILHRQQCVQLVQRCAELIDKLRDRLRKEKDLKLVEAANELGDLLLKIGSFVTERANFGNIESLVRQSQTAAKLNTFHHTIDAYATKFEIMSATGLNRQWHRVDRGYRRDQEEVEKVLLAFVRNDKDIELAIKEQSDVLALMTTIQETLRKQQPGTEQQITLRKGLNTLYGRTNVLPPLTDLTGQVVKLWGDCTARDNPPDVYEGRWVGTDRVMIKAIKDIEGESTVKLLRQEVVAWRQLQHANVLKFYGICYSEPTLFAITGWEDNGNILRYLQRQPEHDRVELLAQVALGLNYLHTFEPTIVHGDLRAANVLVSASGQAFITGFGINQIIALEEGAEIASAYLKNAGALRWMAPELFGYGSSSCTVSTSSDVWSFGMLCLELFTECPPYWDYTDGEVAHCLGTRTWIHILPVRPIQITLYGRRLSEDLWNIMQRCWIWHFRSRPQMCTIAKDILALCEGSGYETVGENMNVPSKSLGSVMPKSCFGTGPPKDSPISGYMPESVSLKMASLSPYSGGWRPSFPRGTSK